jgi:phosphoglycerate dehydrogenase-like enzyme
MGRPVTEAAPGPVNVVVVPDVWTGEEHYRQIAQVDPRIRVIPSSHSGLVDVIGEAEIIAGSLPQQYFAAARWVRWVHLFSGGAEHALYPQMVASDILLTSSKGVHAIPIAEHALMFMLLLQRHMGQYLRWQREHRWGREWLHELTGKTLLIIGLGATGRELARKAAAFDMRIMGVKRRPEAVPGVDRVGGPNKLPELFPLADFVVVTAPNTPQTRGLVGSAEIAAMKRTAYLINVSRGSVVDQAALERALAQRSIAGAGLDVFEREPLPADSPLWDMESVFITPHNSAATWDIGARIIELFCDNLGRYLRGEPLANIVDKQAGY